MVLAYEIRKQDLTPNDYFTRAILGYLRDTILKDIILSNKYDSVN